MLENFLENLNEEQQAAVTFGAGPLLIVAGAGTGKTTVITRRIAWLIQQEAATPEQILALTFTEKAAGEMEERVDQLLPYGYVDLWISTFHAFCERVLHEYAMDIGFANDFKLLNETETWLLIRNNWDQFDLDYYRPLGRPTKFIQALVQHFSRAKDEDISPADYIAYAEKMKLDLDVPEGLPLRGKGEKSHANASEAARIAEVARAYQTYQQILAENEAMDFGDLMVNALKLFRDRPKILQRFQEQFRYVLVDEFQDTNYAQYELVKLLSAPKNNLTIVGDDDQSIFKFRGASISNILEFKRDYPDSQEVVLTKNYRSRQEILDLAYNFIQLNNPYRLEARLSDPNLKKEILEKGKLLDQAVVKKLQSQVGDGAEILHLHAETVEDEARMVTEKILQLKDAESDVRWNHFAVLVRANDSAEVFLRMFERANIPYQFVASKGLFQKPEVMDLLSYFRCLDNYRESRALYRVWNFPTWEISPEEQSNLLSYAYQKSLSLYEVMMQAPAVSGLSQSTIAVLQKITGLLEKHAREAREKNVSQVALDILEETGYLKYINHLSQKEEGLAREKTSHLEQVFRRMSTFERASADRSVGNFVREIDLEIEAGDTGSLIPNMDEGPETVKVMTVHAAKGLEFDFVFIVNMVDKRFPSVGRRDAIELPEKLVKEIVPEGDVHLQEERRLFYVACTRAKRGLYFSSAEDYGGARKKKLSRFLVEAGVVSLGQTSAPLSTGRVFFDLPKAKSDSLPQNPTSISLPEQFSFTQLEAFRNCPYQYRLAHVLHIPVPGKSSFSFGKTLHATLQRFFQLVQQRARNSQSTLFGSSQENTGSRSSQTTTDVPMLEELLALYEQCWIDDWYSNKKQEQDHFKKGKEALTKWYESHHGIFPVPKYLEQKFKLTLGDAKFKGAIDRIDTVDGGVEIIDYKSGRKPKNPRDIKKDQLYLYALAAKEVLKEDVKKLTFYYVNEQEGISIDPEKKTPEETKKELMERMDEIRKSDFTATPSKYTCRNCDFNKICEFRAK